MFNGQRLSDIPKQYFDIYPKSVFFEQHDHYIYYNKKGILVDDKDKTLKNLLKLNRISGNINYYLWSKSIRKGNFSFSYGSRIHGNIIALQNGIPSFVKVIDGRVREIVEFYNIPNSMMYRFDESTDDLFDLYNTIDVSIYNETRKKRFLSFHNWLEDKGIDNVLTDNYEFKEYLAALNYEG